ncbi:MAG: hypothetical protein IJW82_06160 [Clostridia bacterium]|nr:hypothetical protein [Clostridia bacterium]
MYKEARQNTIVPYAEKMGNCQVICLGGDHFIYQQRTQECLKIVSRFIEGLD